MISESLPLRTEASEWETRLCSTKTENVIKLAWGLGKRASSSSMDGEGLASSADGDSHTGNVAGFLAPLGETSPVSRDPRQLAQSLRLRNHVHPCVL